MPKLSLSIGLELIGNVEHLQILNWHVTLPLNSVAIGALILLNLTGIISIREPYYTLLLYYTALNLVSIPVVVERRFVTPGVAHPACPWCGSPMATSKLKCMSCGKESS
jgi:hypothetical protein